MPYEQGIICFHSEKLLFQVSSCGIQIPYSLRMQQVYSQSSSNIMFLPISFVPNIYEVLKYTTACVRAPCNKLKTIFLLLSQLYLSSVFRVRVFL